MGEEGLRQFRGYRIFFAQRAKVIIAHWSGLARRSSPSVFFGGELVDRELAFAENHYGERSRDDWITFGDPSWGALQAMSLRSLRSLSSFLFHYSPRRNAWLT
jgi:hypothetical protein